MGMTRVIPAYLNMNIECGHDYVWHSTAAHKGVCCNISPLQIKHKKSVSQQHPQQSCTWPRTALRWKAVLSSYNKIYDLVHVSNQMQILALLHVQIKIFTCGMRLLSACASSSGDPSCWLSACSKIFCCSFIWMFWSNFCLVSAEAVETWAGADAMATGLSGLTRLGGGATGIVVVTTLDTRGRGSTTVWAITSVTLGGFSPVNIMCT